MSSISFFPLIHTEVEQERLAARRKQAIDILQNSFPCKIEHIQKLIAYEDDLSSVFYKDVVFEPSFTQSAITQLSVDAEAQIQALKQLNLSESGMTGSAEKTVMPEDIVGKGKKVFGEEETVEGVRVGMHWFEVMKVNKI